MASSAEPASARAGEGGRADAPAGLRGRPAHRVLHVIHGHGGGTEHHARALIDASRAECRHYLAIAMGDSWQIEEHQDAGAVRTFDLRRRPGEGWPEFVGGICATFGIGLMHLHNISGCRDGIVAALAVVGVPYGYTVHDLGFACPTLLFLGADGSYCYQKADPAVCGACLSAQPAFAHVDIEAWRKRHGALVAGARFLIAPSRWAAAALLRYYPGHAVTVVPHAPAGAWALQPGDEAAAGLPPIQRGQLDLPDDAATTIAVLGAVGPDKGARRLERLVALVRAAGLPVRFVLIGYMDVEHGPWQSDDAVLTVHGRYEPRDLPDLLAHYRARLVAFPSAGPETFSFTLSEAWAAGQPVVVPPFGALAERVAESGAGWAWTDDEWRDEARMLARMATLIAPANAEALAAAARRGRAVVQASPSEMAARTLRLYDAAAATGAATTFRPFEPARLREAPGDVERMPGAGALGAPPVSPEVAATRFRLRLAATVHRLAATPPGRLLYRLTPARMRGALKARLR
jgi:glycosyltransferase involved in cell wall biosynthesis